jgi:ADP-heptose:LPS heptosyltransferase
MQVSTLRAVDRWLGVPACVLLTLHRRVFRRRAAGQPARRILFVKLAEQGSTVLAADALAAAVDRVGRGNVFFLAFEENRFVLDAMDVIPAANVLTLDASTFARAAVSIARLPWRLRSLRIDAAVDLEFFARSSAILAYLSGAAARVGLHSYNGEGPYRGDLFTHRLAFNPHLHTSRLFRLSVDALDHPPERFPAFDAPAAESPAPPIEYHAPPAAVDAVRRVLQGRLGTADLPPLILLNANCSDVLPLRKWDGARYVELARRLLATLPGTAVVFTGSPNEADEASRLAGQAGSPRAVSLAGMTTFPELLALYSLGRVLVTNDSGPAHFATLTPIRVVTLFGPETPALFAARTGRNRAIWAGLACSPCVSAFNNRLSACRDNVCMRRIDVDEVFKATMAAYTREQD